MCCRKEICTIPSTQNVLIRESAIVFFRVGAGGGNHPHQEKTVIITSGYSSCFTIIGSKSGRLVLPNRMGQLDTFSLDTFSSY